MTLVCPHYISYNPYFTGENWCYLKVKLGLFMGITMVFRPPKVGFWCPSNYARMYIYIHIYLYISIYTYFYIYIHIYICTFLYIHTFKYIHITYIYIYLYLHIYIHLSLELHSHVKPPAIKHVDVTSAIYFHDFPSHEAPLTSRIFHCHLIIPESISNS